VPSITYSALAVFKLCPRKYAWKHVEQRPEAPSDPKKRYLGHLIHKLIETFYLDQMWVHGGEAYDMLQMMVPATAKRVIEEERYEIPEDVRLDIELQLTPLIFRALNTIKRERLIGAINHVERRLQVPFPGGWEIRGRADLAYFTQRGWSVVDGKSGHWPVSPDQLRIYAMGLEADPAIKMLPYRVGFWWFEKGTIVWKQIRPKLLLKFSAGVSKTLARLDAGEVQPTPGTHCRACDYRKECPEGIAWKLANTKPGSLLDVPSNAVTEVSL
jgi:hypothetical protein